MTTTTFVTGVTVIEADWLNDVDASTYGTRPVATGGTGATTAADARTNLGLGSVDNTADTAKPVSTAQQTALDLKANLASPTLTGTPIAPTAAVGTNTTQIATTAHVFAERTATATLTNKTLASPVLTGSLTLPAVTLSPVGRRRWTTSLSGQTPRWPVGLQRLACLGSRRLVR